MGNVRAALYLDFDNVFSGLYHLDPDVAVQFASDPGVWLHRLSSTLAPAGQRRWLILRCYLNPSGWVPRQEPVGDRPRLYFSTFRPAFVRVGFEVVDCPRYGGTKNGADIRIVVDAVDALAADTHYDEFVVASGDSDMTPLLQRLRRSDRRTMIVSPTESAAAFTAIADHVLDGQQLLALVQGESVDLDDDLEEELVEDPGHPSEPYEKFRSVLTGLYTKANEPMNMASVAERMRDVLGDSVSDTNWFGHGGFARAVESLSLPDLRMSQHFLWNGSRHEAPEAPSTPGRIELPDIIERLADLLGLPRLDRPSWPAVYRTLAAYARTHRFNLTECTSWTRDQLQGEGLPISRSAVGFVVRGASFGGCPLHRRPPPTAAEIGDAFVGNVLSRVEADLLLGDDEIATVRAWLGGSA